MTTKCPTAEERAEWRRAAERMLRDSRYFEMSVCQRVITLDDEVERLQRERDEAWTCLLSPPHIVDGDDGSTSLEWITATSRVGLAFEADGSVSWFAVAGSKEEPAANVRSRSAVLAVGRMVTLLREADLLRADNERLRGRVERLAMEMRCESSGHLCSFERNRDDVDEACSCLPCALARDALAGDGK